MPIPYVCPGCKVRLNVSDKLAGQRRPCPKCGEMLDLPAAAQVPVPATSSLAATAPVKPAVPPRPAAAPPPTPAPAASSPPHTAAWIPPTRSGTPTWLRHLHWCLALAMVPLAINIFVPGETREQLEERFERSFESVPDEPTAAEPTALANGPSEDMDIDIEELDVFQFLPEHKLRGAFLSRYSWLPWGFALAAAGLYLTFCCFLASDKSANPLHLLGLGLFTATGGIALLLGVQFLAAVMPLRVPRGIIGLVLLLLALIGASYVIAEDPNSGVIASFLGFTAGVGFCEEVCKAIPLLVYYREPNKQTWRGAFLWGLASGVGFGVAEGIMYSQSFYNGVSGWDIYVVRFISCVALHAVWSGSVGISINQRQQVWQEEHEEGWISIFWYLLAVLQLVAIPMVLHGLYDTLLKKEMNVPALLTAVASFGYLAWQISRLRQDDDQEDRAKFVADYIRRRALAH